MPKIHTPMKKTLLTLWAAVLGLLPVFAQGGRVLDRQVLHSTLLDRDIAYTVYLPADYDRSDRHYPILYLLHGYGGDEANWLYYGEMNLIADRLTAEGRIQPTIIVSPNADNGWYVNRADGSDDYEKMFIEEFIPHIERTYRTIGDKSARAVGGLSMGGYGALLYSFRHPDMFSVCIALSAAVLTDEELLERFSGKGNGFEMMEIYGCRKDRLSSHWHEHSILEIVPGIPDSRKRAVALYLDCGDDDFLYRGNSTLHMLLRDCGIPHEYRVRDGGHSWTYWRRGLEDGLLFMHARMRH